MSAKKLAGHTFASRDRDTSRNGVTAQAAVRYLILAFR
jgi:hypothetical protein